MYTWLAGHTITWQADTQKASACRNDGQAIDTTSTVRCVGDFCNSYLR
jgi:hypothetical protein